MNIQDIQHHIIRTLRQAGDHPLEEEILRAQVNSRIRPRPPKADVDDAMDNLKRIGYILCMENELDGENPFWLLDERGLTYAKRNQL